MKLVENYEKLYFTNFNNKVKAINESVESSILIIKKPCDRSRKNSVSTKQSMNQASKYRERSLKKATIAIAKLVEIFRKKTD